jgi:sirohydrochlorin cobaltochelatase
MNEGIILLGHGSRHPGLDRPFAGIKQWMQAELGPAALVEDAYLSLCPPTLDQAAEALLAKGLRRVTVLPLFLVAGHHVSVELPVLLAGLAERHPELELALAPHLGAQADISGLLLARLGQARPCAPAPLAG